MVARWRQQKEIKIKRQRMKRAWSKPYGMKRTGIVANPIFLNSQNEPVDMSLGSRAKAGKTYIPPHVDAKFRDHNPLNKIPTMVARSPDAPPEVLLDRIEDILDVLPNCPRSISLRGALIQSRENCGSLQSREHWVVQRIQDTKASRLYLYMCRDKAMFVWITSSGTQEVHRRSIIYIGKRNAMSEYVGGTIVWVETQTKPSSS